MKTLLKVLLVFFAVVLAMKFVLVFGLAYKMMAWIIAGIVGLFAVRSAGLSFGKNYRTSRGGFL